ncbi:MAG: hypothetical protein ACRERD_10425 [Candidatus Binatia bacterium]
MKVNKAIRDLHQDAMERYGRVAVQVKELLQPKVEAQDWFFIGRLKGLESFALKIETGRVDNPSALEDFFACTVVVHRLDQIAAAEQLVLELFDERERRPPDDTWTHKRPSDFAFDALRLYVTYPSQESGLHEDLVGMVFEVQIKTVLQHAWTLATHDLIYKTDAVSWPKERIAFQVKAMLEHAEVAITEAEALSESSTVTKQDEITKKMIDIIEVAAGFWPADDLPKDRKRMAETLLGLMKAADIGVDDLPPLLEAEKTRLGALPLDLDPYAFTVQALANTNQFDLRSKLNRNSVKIKIFIHDGMEIPDWMRLRHNKIVNISNLMSSRDRL